MTRGAQCVGDANPDRLRSARRQHAPCPQTHAPACSHDSGIASPGCHPRAPSVTSPHRIRTAGSDVDQTPGGAATRRLALSIGSRGAGHARPSAGYDRSIPARVGDPQSTQDLRRQTGRRDRNGATQRHDLGYRRTRQVRRPSAGLRRLPPLVPRPSSASPTDRSPGRSSPAWSGEGSRLSAPSGTHEKVPAQKAGRVSGPRACRPVCLVDGPDPARGCGPAFTIYGATLVV
ncbi:hypothetical protein BH18ACT4_BH18ACT4_03340 [soil metagenome]